MLQFLMRFRISQLKEKIKRNPFLGKKQDDGSYYYRHGRYRIGYNIIKNPTGNIEKIEWLFIKRRLALPEEKIRNIKAQLDNFFLYQRWAALLRPSLIVILIASLAIFYFGIKESTNQRIERFKWAIAQISGVNLKYVKYKGAGRFDISGERKTAFDEKAESITISINPLKWLFFSETADVGRWDEKTKQYISYPVSINDSGDVWLGKKGSPLHGKISGDKLVWDEPQGVRNVRVSGHSVNIEEGKLKISDE